MRKDAEQVPIPDWTWHGQVMPVHLDVLGAGPPVLLLPAPSSISSRAEMAPLQRRLAATCRAVAMDWPSFGEAARPPIVWTPEALSKFLTHVLHNAVGVPAAVVAAGHAATYALHHAAAHPGEILRLVLIAPTWRGPLRTMAGGDRPLFHRLRRAVEAPLIGPLLYRANVSGYMLRRMAGGHVYADPAFMTDAWVAAKSRVTSAGGARFGTAAFVTGGLDRVESRDAFLDLARRAGAPITLIYGSDTPPKSRAEMEALAALPGVDVHRLPRGKLAVHEEFPDAVFSAFPAFG
jgi:pimeloyl-ACP methyl ester carboxylesterase